MNQPKEEDTMNTIKKVENLTEFLTESVENVVNTVERVHQTALDVPANLLKVVGLSEATAEKVKAKQHQVVGSKPSKTWNGTARQRPKKMPRQHPRKSLQRSTSVVIDFTTLPPGGVNPFCR